VTAKRQPLKVLKPAPKSSTTDRQRWPSFEKLASGLEGTEAIKHILQSMDELNVVSELKASSAENIKGNKWSKLHCHLFIGSAVDGRPALLGRHAFLPALNSPVLMKAKMLSLLSWMAENEAVEREAKVFAQSLLDECDLTKKKEEGDRDKKAAKIAHREKAMATCERGQGFLPPGAKGDKAGGKTEHSTNHRLGQPADFGYATTQQQKKAPKTPNTAKTTPTMNSSVNNKALTDLQGLNNNLGHLCNNLFPGCTAGSSLTSGTMDPRAKKKRKLEQKELILKDDIALLKSVGEDFKEQMARHKTASDELMQLVDESDDDDSDGE